MIDALIKAAAIPKYIQSAEPFAEPPKRLHTVIVGGTYLQVLSSLFPGYALEATVIIPSTLTDVDLDNELSQAIQFEDASPQTCRGSGVARDLGGFDTDSADLLILCSSDPGIRSSFLAQAWRVVREFGKIVIFSPSELPLHQLANFGIANPVYYATEGFYIGTMRRSSSLYARN